MIVILFPTLGRIGALLGVSGRPLEVFLVAELLVLSLVAILAVRKIRPPETLTRTLNLIGLVLVILNIVPIVAVQSNAAGFRFRAQRNASIPLQAVRNAMSTT